MCWNMECYSSNSISEDMNDSAIINRFREITSDPSPVWEAVNAVLTLVDTVEQVSQDRVNVHDVQCVVHEAKNTTAVLCILSMSGWPEARLRETSRVVVKTLRPIQDFVQGYMGKGAVLRAIAISDRRKIKGYLKKLAKLRERLMHKSFLQMSTPSGNEVDQVQSTDVSASTITPRSARATRRRTGDATTVNPRLDPYASDIPGGSGRYSTEPPPRRAGRFPGYTLPIPIVTTYGHYHNDGQHATNHGSSHPHNTYSGPEVHGPPNIGEWSPPRTEPMTTDDHWDDYHYQQPEIPMYDLSGQRGEDIHVDVDVEEATGALH